MKIFVSTLLAAALSTSAAAAAESANFVGGTLGFNIDGASELSASAPGVGSASADIDQETGLFVSGQVGRQLNETFSVDGELLYIWHDLDAKGFAAEADEKAFGVMVNAQAKFLPSAQLHPYIGAGVGYGQTKVSIDSFEDEDAGFMWQIKAGVTAPVSDKVSLDVGYRYLSLPDYEASESGATLKLESDVHLVTFGMRYGF